MPTLAPYSLSQNTARAAAAIISTGAPSEPVNGNGIIYFSFLFGDTLTNLNGDILTFLY